MRATSGGRGCGAQGRRSFSPLPRAVVLVALALWIGGCGGADEADVARILGTDGESTPVATATTATQAAALGSVTAASQISFQAGSKIELEMFDEAGRCLVNATDDIIALVGDYRGRAVAEGTPIAFFVASGRGIIQAEVPTDDSGLAKATFRSLCPTNAHDDIILVSAVRGAEPFVDLNSNARHDQGEPFTDLNREAFLDANKNGSYEPQLGEYLIWDPNHNGLYDAGGNGAYDVDNIIISHAIIIPTMKKTTPGPGTPGSGTPGSETPGSGSPTPTRTPSVVPAFLQVALFSNQASDNNDGTLSTVVTAQVSDANGVALDGIPVAFRLLPPVRGGTSVTSPVLSGDQPACSLSFTVRAQPGNSLSCVKYDTIEQGATITIEASVDTPTGPLLSVQLITLPDIRIIPPPTPSVTVSPTPKPVPKFLSLAVYSNLVSLNSDGTLETALTAVVGDRNGVALDNILVNFRILPPVHSGIVVTSPGVTGGELPCVIVYLPPYMPPPAQPGDALTCLKYDTRYQGETVVVEASIQTAEELLIATTPVRLPIFGSALPERVASLHLALFDGVDVVNNGDGTFSTVVAALVSDSDGVALDGINVGFRQLPPINPRAVITSPGVSGSTFACDLAPDIFAQHGQALTCVKYDGSIGGQQITLEARVERSTGPLITSQSILLPDFRVPTLSPTPTSTQTPLVSITPSPSPTATATFQASSIIFVSAEPGTLGVRQSGKPEQSTITFLVTDAFHNPIRNVRVVFQLTAIGGEHLSTLEGVSNSSGMVSTVLTSGTRAAPVRVSAGADVDGDGAADVFTQSTQIAVLSAPPAQNRFSVAAERLNVPGRVLFGINNPITAYVNDRFGNAVPAGTAVSFISNGASVVNQVSTDESGQAIANLITEGGIPASGIVTVLAFTRGEEGFRDTNGDGVFQADRDQILNDNRPEPYVDYRPLPPDLATVPPDDEMCPIPPVSPLCNDLFDASEHFELFVDSDRNGVWNNQGISNAWDTDLLVYDTISVTFSGPLQTPVFTPSTFAIPNGGSQVFEILIHDDLRNPIAPESTIKIETSKGSLLGDNQVVPDGESFNQIVPGLTKFFFVLGDANTTEGNPPEAAQILITIDSPNAGGKITFFGPTGTID